jgi:nucleoside-diphosphate-sugar epimerase
MRILLTGANGFTGRHFQDKAVSLGHEVVAFQADLTRADDVMAEVLDINPSHVLHLAGISAVTHADENAFYQVNVLGTQNLLQALSNLNPRPAKVVLASSANVYGNASVSPITEDYCPKPVNHYAISKLAMELMSTSFAEQLPIVIGRPFNYTGVWHDNRFVVPKIIEHVQRRAPEIELGDIDVLREYNDVRDVCQCYLGLLTAGQSGQTYNIASGRTVSLRQVLAMLESMSGLRMAVHVNPSFIRPNEIRQLAGNGAHLQQCIGPIDWRPLDETLRWMLDATH